MVRTSRLAALASSVGLLAVVPAASAARVASIGSSLQLANRRVNVPVTYSCMGGQFGQESGGGR